MSQFFIINLSIYTHPIGAISLENFDRERIFTEDEEMLYEMLKRCFISRIKLAPLCTQENSHM